MGIKNFLLDVLFPKFCLICKKEGDFLCQDCESLLSVSGFHQKYSTSNLKDLYFAATYQNKFLQNLILQFKYEPFVKELAKPLSSLIITHFQLMVNPPNFSDFLLVPVPQSKKKFKIRGFSPAEEIGKALSNSLKIPLVSDCLMKIKETAPQVELSDEERRENVKGVFFCQNQDKIKNRKILLLDDVYTTGSTMEECAKVLKSSGAKEVVGIVIARG